MKRKTLPLILSTVFISPLAYSQGSSSEPSDIKVSLSDGLKISTNDGASSLHLGGRLQWDYTDDSTTVAGAKTNAQDLDVRRARMFLLLTHDVYELKAQFNIGEAGSGGSAEDLYLRYKGFGSLATLTLGKQNLPFGLDRLNSSNDMPMLERAAMTERFAFDRAAGLQLSGKTKRMTYGVGVFEGNGDQRTDDFGDQAIAARVTYTPVATSDLLVHVGAGAATVTGPTAAEERDTYNLEFAGTYGPTHWQAEYFSSDESAGNADGYYAQVGYVMTGQSRPYKDGKFRRLKPQGSGIWETVLRYESGDGRFSDVGLGRTDAEQTALGLNYYPNNNVRFGLSYMVGDEKQSADKGEELRLRAQFTF